MLATVSRGAAEVLAKELKCGCCGDLLLEARLLPCSHGYCRLCFHGAFVAAPACDASAALAAGAAPLPLKRPCAVCKAPVPHGFRALGSMHLENMVDLVVESLGGAAQQRFSARRSVSARVKLVKCVLLLVFVFRVCLRAYRSPLCI